MNRREALQNLTIAAGSFICLPQWMRASGSTAAYQHLSSFTRFEQQMLASIADTIIPAGTSIGALAVEVDKYLQKIFDDCYEDDVQANIRLQLSCLEQKAQKKHVNSFALLNQQQRLEFLNYMRVSANTAEKDFIELMRRETIRGFTTSQKVLQEHLGYEVAPGRYHGCVEIKS